jgi:alpha-L-fucosidase 2
MNHALDLYNVVWETPSRDASGSMPLGNGDLAVNVWVEEGGSLCLLLAKSDAWDENSTLLKLGRVRVSISPDPFRAGVPFRQVLRLRSGEIEIVAGPEEAQVRLRIWVDANHPVIYLEAEGDQPFAVQAAVELWRREPYRIKTQTGDLFRNLSGPDPYPTMVSPDEVLPPRQGRVMWCHHNESREDDGYEINMRLQGLGGYLDHMPHPLRGRTFGAAMEGEGFVTVDDLSIRSERPGNVQWLSIYALTMHPASIEQWREGMEKRIRAIDALDRNETRRAHERWWTDFWDRSWIYVARAPRPSSTGEAPVPDDALHVTQGYILQRFMNACAGRGAQPIKYNGSLFSVGKPEDPDFRRWGGPGYWFMNQRLIYWPMLACGDFDLMEPWLRMYRDQLPLQQYRTATYYKHGGAHYPETITFWGAEVSAHYGWTPFEQRRRPEAECSYITYYWSGGIELTLILWTHFVFTGDENWAREMLLPIADAVTEFFDVHYPRDADGKIRFEPAQALETWHEATNPLPEIAGLRYVLPKLLELPERLTTDGQRARWRRMLDELPPIPVGEKDGRRVILPAERFDRKKNTENPELYCIFPYRLFGVDKPELELARETFSVRLHPAHTCWSQDDVQMAMLGLAGQARDHLARRASPASHSQSRFPAFWDAFHDWIPDMDHGGVLQLALQSMLMQTEGRRILLLPAWPAEWDVDFRLHAPYQTIVEGKVRGGLLAELRVTPESRRKDVQIAETSS